ncbi:YqaA family protein [Spiribacter vilamensis]|uniref:Membrane protein YqaA with SNARE-associated domain n=1 Tax=Spiribacter vilamensis TaxID=531306 RepID=A0A4Q8CZQ6_9GAMM|nr:YqaA family protein [Spiribacter vilamensis]RZU98474.1 membrane protein YqaA with SNARE-associated domain [Spiribacter vilamensis]TVO60656.1 DedA family protein [Spiribacter vilamensis]
MALFTALYDRVLGWSRHRRAPWMLAGLSFAESSFFPVPPDVMLAPMCMARPKRALRLAALTTGASVAGGVLGYLIGLLGLEVVLPLIQDAGYEAAYEQARRWFLDWGFWVVLVAGFSPIPYKVFTIAAGAMAVAWLPFVLASLLGRGARFFLVAGVISWGGPRAEPWLRRYMERIGWCSVIVLLGIAAYLSF